MVIVIITVIIIIKVKRIIGKVIITLITMIIITIAITIITILEVDFSITHPISSTSVSRILAIGAISVVAILSLLLKYLSSRLLKYYKPFILLKLYMVMFIKCCHVYFGRQRLAGSVFEDKFERFPSSNLRHFLCNLILGKLCNS